MRRGEDPIGAGRAWLAVPGMLLASAVSMAMLAAPSHAAITCERTVTADIVAFDKPLMYNRLGAGNVNGMMYALRRDVVTTKDIGAVQALTPLTLATGLTGSQLAGNVDLRPDKRPRPLVLRVRKGDCLTVNLQNLLTPVDNPFKFNTATEDFVAQNGTNQVFPASIDEQVVDRTVGFHAAGMQLVNSIADDGSFVGENPSSLAASNGGTVTYHLYAEKEGVFVASNLGSTVGSDANQGNTSNGLFGQIIVEPTGSAIYRSQVFEEEMRIATTGTVGGGLPTLDYEAVYPDEAPWTAEGKAGLPVLNMMKCSDAQTCEIVHSEINGAMAYGGADEKVDGNGMFPASTYPLESKGKRNPTLPNRLEPFRDFASVFHDEPATAQAFPAFYVTDPVFRYVLAGVKDGFMINYGSGGIGSEIIANRLGVGPMHDCASCAYEEFFLTSFAVGDPGMTVDIPANLGLEAFTPTQAVNALAALVAGDLGNADLQFLLANNGPKANYAIGAEDPANIHHSYTGDFVKFRNTHIGKEQHVFHLHNHQWLYNPNDDNSNYLDAQGIGPGVGYTYEINFGGSGNRNKSAGDAIFHCHFYPHFAQGMWYHWRNNDTFQKGTILAATPSTPDAQGFAVANGYHATPWALGNTVPAGGARAYPDGEIARGTPIPGLVPLPGKAMAPMPGRATVVAKEGANGLILGSNAKVIDRNVNPGFPFWVAGMEDVMGQRPPTPVLDMLSAAQATALKNSGNPLWADINPAQADGFDGGLPRHALQGYADGAATPVNVVSPIDFSKVLAKAKPVYYPEEGTDLEQVAMAFHAIRNHPSFTPSGAPASFVLNGGKPVVGAPYHNPCIDDQGVVLHTGVLGKFFGPEATAALDPDGMTVQGASVFDSDKPRIYKATNMQFDAVLTKTGYHFPQQRIVALWEDVGPVTAKTKPPEPLVFRSNTFDCTILHHSNLVPEVYEIDDYQVRTPTDIIGQHIHLPKWDLTTTDGAANGWNYEDGTLSPGTVRERIEAINCFNGHADACHGTLPGPGGDPELHPQPHPFFASVAAQLDVNTVGKLAARETFGEAWLGARTTTQRWFIDPVVNTDRTDRGLGIVFTHDHYGPSTHQQIGLYSTLLAEPAASHWAHNETGTGLGCTTAVNPSMPAGSVQPNTTPCRWDGGPTSWQAAILPQPQTLGQNVGAGALDPYREFYFEYSDFQHAYEAGVYMGTNQMGLPLYGTGPDAGAVVGNDGNPDLEARFNLASGQVTYPSNVQRQPAHDNAFRFAINPPARLQARLLFPDLVTEIAGQAALGVPLDHQFCPTRPCPQAIDVQDPGMHVVNYRAEPVALRVYDPNRTGPDGKPGMQAAGVAGDLAFALASELRDKKGNITPITRAIPELNVMPDGNTVIKGTRFPPHINVAGVNPKDPFTPMLRALTGDLVRVKMQAGGHEEEHNASIHGMKWLQTGSGHGKGPNSGWRNAQAGGISEQFTLSIPVMSAVSSVKNDPLAPFRDYAYSMDASMDGWWSGMWGILRAYDDARGDLFPLPNNTKPVINVANRRDFNGVCPIAAPVEATDVVAILANDLLGKPGGVTINPDPNNLDPANPGRTLASMHAGGPLAGQGTLVYNPRGTPVTGTFAGEGGEAPVTVTHAGPIHDPTAILYVRASDLQVRAGQGRTCSVTDVNCAVELKPGVKVEPLVLRGKAGSCVQVTLYNRVKPADTNGNGRIDDEKMPDLPTLATIQGIAKRDRFGVEGSTTFDNNLIAPSAHVGLHAQLVTLDVSQDDGTNVGSNIVQTVPPAVLEKGKLKTQFTTYKWYAGDLTLDKATNRLEATPVEFGGTGLMPADKVKQGQKSLVGALVVVPQGATVSEDAGQHAQARVTAGGKTFRDLMLVMTKDLNHRFADGFPVEHMNGEAVGIPEDSQESSAMAFNYGIEPLWFRAGILPQAPFGKTGYAGIPDQHAIYSNGYRGINGDPATPVFTANPGEEVRMHIAVPHTTSRGSTLAIHGHVWQRDPYVCPGESRNGLTGACYMTGVGSRALGDNPMGFAQGGQESLTGSTHFTFLLPSAGGGNAVTGDYLFRDVASFGNASGLWGILRVGQ